MSVTLSASVLRWLQSNADKSLESQLWDELTKKEKNALVDVRESVLVRQEEEEILKRNYTALQSQYLALEELHTFFLGALDFFPLPIFIKNNETSFVFVNRAYETIFDFHREAMIGKKVVEVFHINDVEKHRYQQEDEYLLEEQKMVNRQIQLDCATGAKDCLYWCTGFKDANFNRNGLVGTFVNITDLVKETSILTLQLREIIEAKNQIEALVHRDHLTGLYNRFSMRTHFVDLMAHEECFANPFSIIMFDIDHFKSINDQFGHVEGDHILQKVSEFLNNCMRKIDISIRYGGEEFLLLLPKTGINDACAFAQRLCDTFPQKIIKSDGSPVNASFGVTQYIAGENIESIIHRVDSYLYKSKHNGRACVSFG